jgi:tetratricopeptide (TPR) repeat protein
VITPLRALLAAGMALLLTPLTGMASQQHQQRGSPPARQARDKVTEALRLNNLGAAYMGQQRFAEALKLFEQAYALDPKLESARLNQGIALLNLQRFEPARVLLLEIVKRQPEDARAWYNLGLLYKAQGQAREALDAFQHAAQLAPQDPDAAYFVGSMASQLQRDQDAIPAFERALQLNPFHASAEFGLARAYQHLGRQDQARKHFARFQQLTQAKLGVPMSLAYGDQGALSIAEQARPQEQIPGPAVPVKFASVGREAGITPATTALSGKFLTGTGACFLDFDKDNLPDLYVAGSLYRNLGNGKFTDVTRRAMLPELGVAVCAAGDYDNDGFVDLALAAGDRLILLKNEHNGTFSDVSSAVGLQSPGRITGLMWVDYDHDGDLDLYVTTDGATGRGSAFVWRNNGNGTFLDVTGELALAVQTPSAAATATDFNNDRAIDLVATGASTELFANPREGRWTQLQPWTSGMPAATVAVAAMDFNKDGWMDLAFTHGGRPGLTLWRNVGGKSFERVQLPEMHWSRGWGLIALDYDNDGWIDVAALGETEDGRGELRLLRNEGSRGFRDVTSETGLDRDKLALKSPRAIAAADFDSDGDNDLVVTQEAGPTLLLHNDGGNQNHSLRLLLEGLNDNKSAIGAKVEVFAGDLWQKWEIGGAGFLGQSATGLLVGLGNRRRAEVVRMLWPTGVVQDETEVAAGKAASIVEIDRRGSSCPLLFAWDGAKYRFVSDIIGAGVVGHWIAPGTRNVPDSTEYLKVEGFEPRLRNRHLSFRFMEPMEEVVYLDQVRLLAVDHPSNALVYPNEYFASNTPFPQFKVIASRNAQPVRAWDDSRREVTLALRSRDHQYITGFELLPFKGFTRPHSLEIDLGQPYSGGPLRLLLAGYIEYFTATSMYAAHQAGLEPVAPYVEVLDASGKWVRVLDDMGFPAGLPRTITVDLTAKLPAGSHRLRMTTNLQIYWDQIVVDRTPNNVSLRLSEVPLARASLEFHGYPRAVERGTPGDLTYVYEDVSRTGPYVRASGAYTRRGDVRELLTRVDDRFVVFGSGEAVALEFDPSGLPPLPPAWKRDYFFFADGYEKDMDFYAAEPLTVEPLPFHDMGVYPYSPRAEYPDDRGHRQYRLDFNTRFSSGAPPSSYQFHYRSPFRGRNPVAH